MNSKAKSLTTPAPTDLPRHDCGSWTSPGTYKNGVYAMCEISAARYYAGELARVGFLNLTEQEMDMVERYMRERHPSVTYKFVTPPPAQPVVSGADPLNLMVNDRLVSKH